MVPINLQFVMQNTYTYTHLKWKNGNLVAPKNPCKFQRFICILQCTLCPIFMRTTPEVHTSLLSLVPINILFIIRGFGSGKYQIPVGHLAWSFLQTGLSGLLFFRKRVLSGIFRGVLNTTLFFFFCFSFLYLGMSHYRLLVNIFGGRLHCVDTRQLICKMSWLAGFYMVWDFARGIFEPTIA